MVLAASGAQPQQHFQRPGGRVAPTDSQTDHPGFSRTLDARVDSRLNSILQPFTDAQCPQTLHNADELMYELEYYVYPPAAIRPTRRSVNSSHPNCSARLPRPKYRSLRPDRSAQTNRPSPDSQSLIVMKRSSSRFGRQLGRATLARLDAMSQKLSRALAEQHIRQTKGAKIIYANCSPHNTFAQNEDYRKLKLTGTIPSPSTAAFRSSRRNIRWSSSPHCSKTHRRSLSQHGNHR